MLIWNPVGHYINCNQNILLGEAPPSRDCAYELRATPGWRPLTGAVRTIHKQTPMWCGQVGSAHYQLPSGCQEVINRNSFYDN